MTPTAFNNILGNPTLSGRQVVRQWQYNGGTKKGVVERPDGWRFVHVPAPFDPPPESRQVKAGGYKVTSPHKWEAGYVKDHVVLAKGQRYLLKATLQPGKSCAWCFALQLGKRVVQQPWQHAQESDIGKTVECQFVVQSADAMRVNVAFQGRGEGCALTVLSIEMLEVPGDYGADRVTTLHDEPVEVLPDVAAAVAGLPSMPDILAPLPPPLPLGVITVELHRAQALLTYWQQQYAQATRSTPPPQQATAVMPDVRG
jgi:hypothetical protein